MLVVLVVCDGESIHSDWPIPPHIARIGLVAHTFFIVTAVSFLIKYLHQIPKAIR